jgi:hypothetical protein
VVGNCGASPAPLTPARRQDVIDTSALTVPPLKWDPHRYPTGIPWVLVNGRPVIAGGRHTGARPGQLVTR